MSATLANSAFPRALNKSLALSRAGWMFLTVFVIIVFEGALRKWLASSVTLPLILLRDVTALLLIFHAWRYGHLRRQMKVVSVMIAWSCLVLGWGLLQLVGSESSPTILIIGLRFWLLYSWFAVAAFASLTEADYRASIIAGACMMLVMAPLAVVQHFSPPGARINTQLDTTDEEGIFVAVVGVVRTTGTFSFTSGYATFMTTIAPLVFGILSARKNRSWQFMFALAVFTAFAVGALVSGSRTAVISSGMMFVAYLAGRLFFSKVQHKPAAALAVVAAVALFALFAYFFQESISVTQTRFEQASEAENFWGRVLTILFGESDVYKAVGWLGSGVGYGSNLATFVRVGTSEAFALAESEGGRILLEGGLLGFAYTFLKIMVIGVGIFKSLRLSAKTNSPYPLIVWLAATLAILTWQSSGQLTANGLFGIVLAFALLVFRYPRLEIFPRRISQT